jgi:hypothetical protein
VHTKDVLHVIIGKVTALFGESCASPRLGSQAGTASRSQDVSPLPATAAERNPARVWTIAINGPVII